MSQDLTELFGPTGPLARSLPTVAAGASAQVQWVVRAPAVPDPAPVTLAALGSTAAFAIPLSAGAVGSAFASGCCTPICSPPRKRLLAAAGSPSTVTRPSRIHACRRLREKSGSNTASTWSSRCPASSGGV